MNPVIPNKPGIERTLLNIQQMAQNSNAILGGFLAAGADVTTGFGPPNAPAQLGSLYLRRDGGVNSLWYLNAGDDTWFPISNLAAYGVSGAVVNAHTVVGTVNINASSTATITLTNGATFTSGTSYSVAVATDAASAIGAIYAYAQTSTTFKITNPDGASAHNFQWVATGS